MPDWSVIAIRSLGALIMLFLLTRILGKKQISQLTFFEYILGITLGDLAGFISTDIEANYLHGVVAMLVWFLIPLVVELLALKSKKMRQLFEGSGRVMVKEGKVLEDNLKKERLSLDELLEQMRGKNVFNVADVEFAVMETNGELSILLKKENQPLTPKTFGIKSVNEVEPQTVVMDGDILDEPLATIGLNRGWLTTELEKIGVSVENVFLAQVDAYQQLYVDLYDDKIKVPAPQGKALLLATLKKTQADLELFAAATRNEEAKLMYERSSQEMASVIDSLTPMLRG
ncbi:DUF421 domain-containing protein [Cohnella thailandensis]|uniref:DUF421 domain-containing protein n=1 Tax=Cohnella thailandensis TaxID=557557 RepID=A0A841T8V9_9BACL|nr:DUF421 domain-containing protein [Cohnella thailandensis]MBB6638490.1 DUF421 domain-containing protein [Cohnella thailandensis]